MLNTGQSWRYFEFQNIFYRKHMSKSKTVKANVSITSPKGSLIAQINNLRKQLKDHKQLKKQTTMTNEKPIRDNFTNITIKSPQEKSTQSMIKTAKENFFRSSKEECISPINTRKSNLILTTQKNYFQENKREKSAKNDKKQTIGDENNCVEIKVNEIWVKQKDRKLKFDIELNKLRKTIMKLGRQEMAEQFNYVISLVNTSIREYISRIQILQKNQKVDESDQSLLIKRQQDQIQFLTKKLTEQQEEIKKLKSSLLQKEQQEQSLTQLQSISNQQKSQFRTKAETLDEIAKQFQEKIIELQQENKILASKLLKKQQQLILFDEDINYMRLETENYKQQKKQFSQMYKNILSEYRDYKRSKSLEIEKLIAEKEKWEKECKLRRNESESLNALQEQKITLMKELSEMRHLCNLKSTEFEDKKAGMHQNQKKVILLQSEVYKLKSENQSLRNQKQFAEFENQKLKEEMDDLKKYARKSNSREKNQLKNKPKANNQEQKSNLVGERVDFRGFQQLNETYDAASTNHNEQRKQHYTKKLQDKEDKLRALEDIHSLIKKHRKEMQI